MQPSAAAIETNVGKPPSGRHRAKETAVVIGVSTIAFLLFYFNAYFSEDFKGMLGYEVKDTLLHLQAYAKAGGAGATYYWDPYYLSYTPAFPQAPLHSPVTRLFLLAARLGCLASTREYLIFYLIVAAVLQIICAYTMYLFLTSCGFSLLPALLGGLGYAYNQQTFVFGIRHGYERISALLLLPLVLMLYFQLWRPGQSRHRYRGYIAGTALLLGLALICNGDVKPTAFFMLFMGIAAFFVRPFSWRNIAALGLIYLLAAAVFAVQGLPTVYTFWDSVRGQESMSTLLEFSLRPAKLLLTHITTAFTDRPDYPWESTAEYSLSIFLLALVGLFSLRRHRLGRVIYATLIFSLIWIMGDHTPFGFVVGWIMRISGMHHPARMTILLYFCYSFAAAQAVQRLPGGREERIITISLAVLPLSLLIAWGAGIHQIPFRYILFALCSYLVILGVTLRVLPRAFLWLIVLFFILERATPFFSLEETRVTDPTRYYTYGEIYCHQPRVEAILQDPGHRDYRAFFGGKEYPDLFSHALYLNAFADDIRPIFANFVNEEWPVRVRELQWFLLNDWANPMWDLLNVKYFVDLEALFVTWDEEDISRKGLEHFEIVDEHVRINPGAEKEVFLRYRAQLTDDTTFLENLAAGRLDVKEVAYLNTADAGDLIFPGAESPVAGGEIVVSGRKTDEIDVEVTVPQPAFVIFSEFWFFPWSVEVDGKEARLLRAYNVLQAVQIPAGKHRVRFYFNSRHWKFVLPFIVSYGTVLALLLSIVYYYRQGRKKKESNI